MKQPYFSVLQGALIATFIVATILVSGCESETVWMDRPPKEFQGKFIQVSDEVILGYEKPIIIEIGETEFGRSTQQSRVNINSPEISFDERLFDVYPILKVSKTEKSIVIFCGEPNENHIAEYRFELQWGTDNFLYVSEIVPTGVDDEIHFFSLGKFVDRDYLKY